MTRDRFAESTQKHAQRTERPSVTLDSNATAKPWTTLKNGNKGHHGTLSLFDVLGGRFRDRRNWLDRSATELRGCDL